VSNLSFARIMYGTNENMSATSRMSAPGLASLATGADALNGLSKGQLSLQELLHRAWLLLSSKS
jgi:hypothetical protein